jgi:hypothetical protein
MLEFLAGKPSLAPEVQGVVARRLHRRCAELIRKDVISAAWR